jgi:hypothetical protein
METISPLALPLKVAACLLAMLWAGVSWTEAEKEVRILCGTFAPGQSLDEVAATLETGRYLHYQVHPADEAREGGTPEDGAQRLVVSSYYNGLRSACTVTFEDGLVAANKYRTPAYTHTLFGE